MSAETIYDFEVKMIEGGMKKLSDFKGSVMLIVNTASQCGFTSQYKGLETLYKTYSNKGLKILGFPCNQFGNQEPGDENEIKNFCSLNYEVTFPLFAKVDVNGENADPLYKFLKKQSKGIFGTEFIKWNFTKFLVGKNGDIIKRFAPSDKPEDMTKDIEEVLK
ncbi:glutathione peroxidase [Fluviispira multicolorata]|uniref:Glutathione peroxidase n=1 Tax=Fluviispira multicolorata TaxID=2654512 RepID=A0A833JEA3_9BACT|nr:glutathione peroxidase [Fluviispira multicolorata]KAB8029840.1 redoxin domain-containing protein [Fluviispira multicolorata]